MKGIKFLFSLIIVFGLVALYLINKRSNTLTNARKTEFICATKNLLDDDALEGKRQFNINCSVCHRLQGIVDPPLLQNNFKNYTLETFRKFVKNEERLRENLFFRAECPPFKKLSNQKIEFIFKYLDYTLNQ